MKVLVTKIHLNNEKDVSSVCNIFNMSRYDIDIACGKYLIDGKSLLGLLMFLDKDLDVYASCLREESEELKNKLVKWEI